MVICVHDDLNVTSKDCHYEGVADCGDNNDDSNNNVL